MDEENDDFVVEETKTLSNIEEAEDDAESLPPTPTTIMEASEMYFAQIFSEELLKTAKLHSFDLNILPRWIDCIAAQKILGWTPHFSKISMFQELEKYSELGPERPEWASKGVQQGFTNDDGVEIGMTKKQKWKNESFVCMKFLTFNIIINKVIKILPLQEYIKSQVQYLYSKFY